MQLCDVTAEMLSCGLTYREREVVKLMAGIGCESAYTLAETAKIFKMTRERTRQIKASALRKIELRRNNAQVG